MSNISKIFDDCLHEYAFKRVSSIHPIDLYLGFNDYGQKTLTLIMNDINEEFKSTKLIDVKINNRNDGKKALCFSLIDNSESNIFIKFCEDIIDSTKNANSQNCLQIIKNKWERWINMFKNPHLFIMNEKEIRGLIGELYFLKIFMFKKYGIEKSIESWGGPLQSHKDFEINDIWYEIKTIYQSSKVIKISSVEQLDSINNGYLCTVELEDSNKFVDNSVSLNKIVNEICCLINDLNVRKKFLEKLHKIGYSYFEEYDNYIYSFKNINFYLVDKKFPRILKKDLPKEISTISYELLIANLRDFMEEV